MPTSKKAARKTATKTVSHADLTPPKAAPPPEPVNAPPTLPRPVSPDVIPAGGEVRYVNDDGDKVQAYALSPGADRLDLRLVNGRVVRDVPFSPKGEARTWQALPRPWGA